MDNEVLVYTNSVDGAVYLTHLAPKESIEQVLGALTDEQYEAHISAKAIPASIHHTTLGPITITPQNITRMKASALPTFDEYRDAWTHDGVNFGHDIEKAKNIALTNVRNIRDPLLAKYDGLHARATELNDTAAFADVKAKKQQLRDATNALKNLDTTSATIDQVKAAVPDLGAY